MIATLAPNASEASENDATLQVAKQAMRIVQSFEPSAEEKKLAHDALVELREKVCTISPPPSSTTPSVRLACRDLSIHALPLSISHDVAWAFRLHGSDEFPPTQWVQQSVPGRSWEGTLSTVAEPAFPHLVSLFAA